MSDTARRIDDYLARMRRDGPRPADNPLPQSAIDLLATARAELDDLQTRLRDSLTQAHTWRDLAERRIHLQRDLERELGVSGLEMSTQLAIALNVVRRLKAKAGAEAFQEALEASGVSRVGSGQNAPQATSPAARDGSLGGGDD